MASNLEQDILSLYDKNLKSLYSIHQISKKLNKKYPYINKKVTTLINSQIFRKIVVGRSHLCALNLANEQTRIMLITRQMQKKHQFLEQEQGIRESLENIRASFPEIILAVPSLKKIFVVGSHHSHKISDNEYTIEQIDRTELLHHLEDPRHPMFTDHVLLYGGERFFQLLESIDKKLSMLHSPLVAP